MRRGLLTGVVWAIALLRAFSSSTRPRRGIAEDPALPVPPAQRFIVKHPLLALTALLVGLGVGGAALVVSGVVPIKASSGHWGVTEWFLQFSKRRSVATHSAWLDVPPLGDQALVLRGAGHYESGCRPCHGAPGTGLPRIPAAMTPRPPDLSTRVRLWDPEELFYIVKHGVKFTGMPAWPAQQRDDEVWAVVAFLRTLPELDENSYRRTARGEMTTIADLEPAIALESRAMTPRAIVEICARCHGLDGRGRDIGAFPKVAGQRERYLENSLRAYARGERFSGIMGPIAAALPSSTIAEVSSYYGSIAAGTVDGSRAPASDPSVLERGEAIATNGVPSKDIPSCHDCHGPSDTRRNPAYPILDGQYADYLELQLHLLQARHRGGSPYVRLMHSFVDRLTTEQIRDVAQYYATRSTAGPITP